MKKRFRSKSPVKPARKESHAPAMPAGTAVPLPPSIVRALRKVISRQTRVNLLECFVLLLAVWPALWLFQATADWWFNLPWLVRLFLLLADLAVAGTIIYRFAVQPLRLRLTLERAALHVEKEMPEFRTALISAVELASARPGSTQGSLDLVKELLSRVAVKVKAVDLASRVVKTARLKQWSKWAALAVFVAGGSVALLWPKSLGLVERILLGTEPLPTRTVVISISRDESAVVGADLMLSARAQGVVPKNGLLSVVYANGDRQEIPVGASMEDQSTFNVTLQNVQQSFHYHFVLNDGVGPDYAVTAKTAPVLEKIHLVQTYPAYTGLPKAEMPAGNLTLLAGSKVRIEGRATQALKEAAILLNGVNEKVEMKVGEGDEHSIQGEFTVPRAGLTGLSFPLINTEGVASHGDTVYRVELSEDKAPEVDFSVPRGEKLSVLLRAKPTLVFSAKDDFGLKKLSLKFEIARPALPGGAEPPVETGTIALPLPPAGKASQIYVWDLAAQKPALTEGSSISYWLEAEDNNDVTGPGIGQTPKKTLSIVTEAEKKAELLEILGARASDIDEISNTQKKVNDDLDGMIRKNHP